jgi:subtilisin family serine protease
VTFPGLPSFALTVPSSIAGAANYTYMALYNPTNPSAGWTTESGPATVSGDVFSVPGTSSSITLQGGQTYCLMIFTLTSELPSPTPAPAPTGTAVAASGSPFSCPQNDTNLDAVTRATSGGTTSLTRNSNGLRLKRATAASTGLLAVTYTSSAASGTASTLATSREGALGATLVRAFSFVHAGTVVHVLSVPAAQMTSVEASLRTQSGVVSVAPTGAHRYSTSVTTPYFPNDPYFNGFTAAQNATAQSTAIPATYHVGPYEESNNVPGQWDMHAIGLENAFAYGGQRTNGSGIFNAAALGSSSIKIAIIDTGEDVNHPELASKIVYQKCFITNDATPAVQSTSNFETDPQGHGTDVAGIAAEDTNNAFGFTGAGGNTVIYAYRVFPTPDDTCATDSPAADNDPQCGASTTDIASAIDDAVQQKVNVISMSLGGDACTSTGVDSDPTEGAAVQEAISAGIIVVAASGNSGGSGVAAPGCDNGVIAVGATSLADGVANMTGITGGTPASPIEYVANYTQYGSPNTYQSATSWGIVAPGGDPVGNSDTDDLHWIENIWTTTPYELNGQSSDTSFQGECDPDYGATAATIDCRTLIAGTSMATPHVAGAAALILAVNPSYQSPAAMKQLLCSTADQLPASSGTTNAGTANIYEGCGRLNVYRAMAKAVGDTTLP